jgi:hypothetical protein
MMIRASSSTEDVTVMNEQAENNELKSWLRCIDLEQYYDTFIRNGFGDIEYIREIGLGDRYKK